MKALFFLIHFFVFLAAGTLWAGMRYDERGNPLGAASGKSAASEPKSAQPSSAEQVEGANTQQTTKSPRGGTEAETAETDNENTAQLKMNPLTQVYLENAQLYLRSGRTDKVLEFLKLAQDAGEDSFSREARLQSLWLRGRRGDAGLSVEADAMDESLKPAAILRLADGYYACARELTKKPECLTEAERLYAYLAEWSPVSTEGRLAAFRLGQLLLEQGRLEAALPHLTRVVAEEQKRQRTAIPFDRAWFALGNLYERPWYHRDVHKARLAYQQVLKYSGSPYHQQAKERIRWLERYGTGTALR